MVFFWRKGESRGLDCVFFMAGVLIVEFGLRIFGDWGELISTAGADSIYLGAGRLDLYFIR